MPAAYQQQLGMAITAIILIGWVFYALSIAATLQLAHYKRRSKIAWGIVALLAGAPVLLVILFVPARHTERGSTS